MGLLCPATLLWVVKCVKGFYSYRVLRMYHGACWTGCTKRTLILFSSLLLIRRLLELAMTPANSPIVQKYVDKAQVRLRVPSLFSPF